MVVSLTVGILYFTDLTTYSVSQLTFGTIAVNLFKKIHQFVCYNVDLYTVHVTSAAVMEASC